MKVDSGSHTHYSLIDMLANDAPISDAWSVFIDKYGRMLYQWCQRWGADHHDAEEVVQETLITVFRKISQFRYQAVGGFRTWLKGVAHLCWLELLARQKKMNRHVNDPDSSRYVHARLNCMEAWQDMDRLFEQIANREILDLAMARVRPRIQRSTWNCYESMELKNATANETADLLGMSTGAVYMAVHRVRNMIREEIAALESQDSKEELS